MFRGVLKFLSESFIIYTMYNLFYFNINDNNNTDKLMCSTVVAIAGNRRPRLVERLWRSATVRGRALRGMAAARFFFRKINGHRLRYTVV